MFKLRYQTNEFAFHDVAYLTFCMFFVQKEVKRKQERSRIRDAERLSKEASSRSECCIITILSCGAKMLNASMFCVCVNHLRTPCYTLCFYLAFRLCACFCAYVHAHCLECLREASPCILGGSTVFRRNKTQSVPVGRVPSSHCSKKNSLYQMQYVFFNCSVTLPY